MHLGQLKRMQSSNGRYVKGASFLSKMVHKRVKGWTSDGGDLPV